MSKRNIARATTIVTLLGIVAKIMGFVREQLIAWFFGATGPTDAYMVALAIPTVLSGLISDPICTSFLPVFTTYLNQKDRKDTSKLASSVITLSVGAFLLIGIMAIPFAPNLVSLFAPGFSGEIFDISVTLTRIFFPAFALPLLAALFKAILNSHKEFTIPGLGPFVQNVAIVVLVALLAPNFGVLALGIATMAGYLAHVLIQVPAVRRTGLDLKPRIAFDEGTKTVLKLAIPMVLGGLAGQTCAMIEKNLASRLPSGSISALGFANRLRSLPTDLFIVAVATVIYPSLSEMWARRDKSGMGDIWLTGVEYAIFLCVPSTVGFIILAQPLVRLVFERGAFTPEATMLTASALSVYSIDIVANAISRLVKTGFYSTQDTWKPVILTTVTSVLNIGLAVILVEPLGHLGLALANVLSFWVSAIVGVWMYRKYIYEFPLRKLLGSALKILASSLLMAVFTWTAAHYSGFLAGTGSFKSDLLLGLLIIGGSVIVYLASALLLKCEEIVLIKSLLKEKIKKGEDI